MKKIPLFEAENKELLYHGSTEEFDKFDIDKIGANAVMKYGFGIYLTEDPDVARTYTLGKNPIIYKVRAYNVATYAHWENSIDEYPDMVATILRKLRKGNYGDEIETLQTESEGWIIKDLYEWLAATIGSTKDASEWFNIGGVNGLIAEDSHIDIVYVAFDDSEVKITGKLSEQEEDGEEIDY